MDKRIRRVNNEQHAYPCNGLVYERWLVVGADHCAAPVNDVVKCDFQAPGKRHQRKTRARMTPRIRIAKCVLENENECVLLLVVFLLLLL